VVEMDEEMGELTDRKRRGWEEEKREQGREEEGKRGKKERNYREERIGGREKKDSDGGGEGWGRG